MACVAQVQVYTIGVDYIQTTELQNDNHMKSIVNYGMDSDLDIFVTRNWIFIFILFSRHWKLLEVVRPWNG